MSQKIARASFGTFIAIAPRAASDAQHAAAPLTENVPRAHVEVPSTVHITANGIYWINGWAAKPITIDAKKLPTMINGKEWSPNWIKDGDERGKDQSDTFPLAIPRSDREMEVLGIGDRKGSAKKEKRTLPTLVRGTGELCIDISDPEPRAKWFRLRLNPKNKSTC